MRDSNYQPCWLVVWFGYLKNDCSVHFFHQFPRKRELYGQLSSQKNWGKIGVNTTAICT